MRYLFFFSISFLSCLNVNSQSKETDYKEALRIIDVWLNAQRDFDNLPGIAVAIVKDQNIIFRKAMALLM
jgi:hypothetical protein